MVENVVCFFRNRLEGLKGSRGSRGSAGVVRRVKIMKRREKLKSCFDSPFLGRMENL